MIHTLPFQLIIPTILALIGFTILFYLLWLLVPQSRTWFRHIKGSLQFKKALTHIQRADAFIEQNQYREAVTELRRAIILDVGTSRHLITSLREHYQNVLSRCLVIAEAEGARIDNIVEIERLFLTRSEILSLLVKTTSAYQKLSERRGLTGKGIPSWGKGEFEQKLSEIKQELEENRNKLNEALGKLFSSLEVSSAQSVTYH